MGIEKFREKIEELSPVKFNDCAYIIMENSRSKFVTTLKSQVIFRTKILKSWLILFDYRTVTTRNGASIFACSCNLTIAALI